MFIPPNTHILSFYWNEALETANYCNKGVYFKTKQPIYRNQVVEMKVKPGMDDPFGEAILKFMMHSYAAHTEAQLAAFKYYWITDRTKKDTSGWFFAVKVEDDFK